MPFARAQITNDSEQQPSGIRMEHRNDHHHTKDLQRILLVFQQRSLPKESPSLYWKRINEHAFGGRSREHEIMIWNLHDRLNNWSRGCQREKMKMRGRLVKTLKSVSIGLWYLWETEFLDCNLFYIPEPSDNERLLELFWRHKTNLLDDDDRRRPLSLVNHNSWPQIQTRSTITKWMKFYFFLLFSLLTVFCFYYFYG